MGEKWREQTHLCLLHNMSYSALDSVLTIKPVIFEIYFVSTVRRRSYSGNSSFEKKISLKPLLPPLPSPPLPTKFKFSFVFTV